jgi:DNA repair exonuclease SbcCD ATPase subunit
VIRYIELENWRAYRSFRLDLSPGTTFLVAPNGVGKSSFIEAMQWVLDADARPTRSVMRLGATRSHADIGLIAGEASVRIKRTVTLGPRGGRTPTLTTDAWINDAVANPDDVMALLEEAWGADNRFASHAAFLTDRFADSGRDPDLRAHLTKLHGLDHIQDAVDKIAIALKTATDRADNARRSGAAKDAEIEAAVAAASAANSRVEAVIEQVSGLRAAADAANAALTAAAAVNASHDSYRQWRKKRDLLATAIGDLLGTMPSEIDLRPTVRAAAAAARAQLAEVEAQQAGLRERLATVEEALERLHAASGECPVCRRPLDDATRGHAAQQHEHDLAAAAGQLDALDADPVRTLVSRLAETLASAEALGDPPAEPDIAAVDLAPLEEEVRAARTSLEAALADAGQARAVAAMASAHLDELRATVQAESAVALYTMVAALEAAKAALEKTISDVLDAQLGPVGEEVNRRWEAIFPDRPGLRLDARGRITRPFDDGADLEFESFSSGERVVAKLLLRLATLTSTTNLPFCVVDEPLEHLDPDARSYVARTLAYLGSGESLRQILVTTYEQQLALQLAGVGGDRVHLEFLRTAHVYD